MTVKKIMAIKLETEHECCEKNIQNLIDNGPMCAKRKSFVSVKHLCGMVICHKAYVRSYEYTKENGRAMLGLMMCMKRGLLALEREESYKRKWSAKHMRKS